MAFISGPRQCGKTTLSKQILNTSNNHFYFSWDIPEHRKIWVKYPSSLVNDLLDKKGERPIISFDEIHKAKNWKGHLKGLYDQFIEVCDILVTGSALINVYKKGGDSLLGRYYHFRLHPLPWEKFLEIELMILNLF